MLSRQEFSSHYNVYKPRKPDNGGVATEHVHVHPPSLSGCPAEALLSPQPALPPGPVSGGQLKCGLREGLLAEHTQAATGRRIHLVAFS